MLLRIAMERLHGAQVSHDGIIGIDTAPVASPGALLALLRSPAPPAGLVPAAALLVEAASGGSGRGSKSGGGGGGSGGAVAAEALQELMALQQAAWLLRTCHVARVYELLAHALEHLMILSDAYQRELVLIRVAMRTGGGHPPML